MERYMRVPVLSGIVMAAAIGLGLIHYVAGESSTPNHIVGCVAFAAPFFAAGVLALVAHRRGSSILLVAVAVGLFPISLVSIVMWPILIPAALIAGEGFRTLDYRPKIPEVLISAAVIAGIWGTFAMLLFHQDPANWQTPDGTAGSSDIITFTESLITFAVLLAVLVTSLTVTKKLPAPSLPAPHSA